MSYLVLARRWRPQRFEEIAGQAHVTRILVNALRSGRVAHAYLFTGIRGVGKTTAARILAKALNCVGGPTSEPCGRCDRCVEIAAGHSLDVYEIDGASNRGIDEVRQIIENARYQPAKSRFKIYIIDEVHQVTKDAFNALLKTLEEPPPFVKFILATTEPHRLPETILSRCQRLDFRRVPVREIVKRLREIAEAEKLSITDGALRLIAREAEGSMRDAQSLLEQVLSYAAGGATGPVEERLLQDIFGLAERKLMFTISDAVIRSDGRRCLEAVADVAAQGLDMLRLFRDLVEHFRNLVVVRMAKGGGGAALEAPLIDLPEDEVEELARQGEQVPVETLLDYFTLLANADEAVSRSPYPRFLLETLLVRLATLPQGLSVAEALARLEAIASAGDGPPAPTRAPARGARAAPAAPEAGAGAEQAKLESWRRFVSFVSREKKFLGSYLEKVYPLAFSREEVRLGVEERPALDYLRDQENLSSLREFARRFLAAAAPVTVVPWPGEAGAAPGGGEGAAGSGDLVREAMRIFGGSIKEVKKHAEAPGD
jgi:DNA polymerase-3 subunit gamma/tau